MPNSNRRTALTYGLPTPLYHQIQLVLRERIEQGHYGHNGLLPSEMELSREFDVSRITVARAINELAALGLVERKRGAGTRIKPISPPAELGNVTGLMQSLAEMGKNTSVVVLEFEFVLPTTEVQNALKVGPRDIVQYAVRMRSNGGKPFSYLTSYVPSHIGKNFSAEDLAAKPMLTLLERANVTVASARQTFSAVLAEPKVAMALDVSVGAPLLSVTRALFDQAKNPVEFIRILYRPDRFQYTMTLEHDQKTGSKFWASQLESPQA